MTKSSARVPDELPGGLPAASDDDGRAGNRPAAAGWARCINPGDHSESAWPSLAQGPRAGPGPGPAAESP